MGLYDGHLSRERDLQLVGRGKEVWIRRGILTLLTAFVLLGMLDFFGQGSQHSEAAGSKASLTLDAPNRLRGGLVFEGRFDITATDSLQHPTLRLAPGWTTGMSLNTIEPAPASEKSRDGDLYLEFDPLPAGSRLTVWTQWQVNPVNTGTRAQDVELLDGSTHLAAIDRDVTVFP